jgi:hypothetical protein
VEKELKAKLIISLPLFRVGEDLVGLRNFFELLRGVGIVLVLIRMPF